jgi:hypothetical protein
MADESNAKTPLDAMQDTLSRLKEMEHYSKKQYEKMVDEVLKRQNQFQESITSLIEVYEKETSRLLAHAQEGSSQSETVRKS